MVVVALVITGNPLTTKAQSTPDQQGIWGKIDHYSDNYAIVDGKKYEFSKTTIIDTYSLNPDKRGNVRVVLDEQGRVAQLFFYGIDMPAVVKQFRR
jgi:hypothetical protein